MKKTNNLKGESMEDKIYFKIYPTKQNVGWGKLKTVKISLPKNKFGGFDDFELIETAKYIWEKKTSNTAKKVVLLKKQNYPFKTKRRA